MQSYTLDSIRSSQPIAAHCETADDASPSVPVFKGIPAFEELARFKAANKPLLLGIPLAATKSFRKCQLDCGFCFVEQEERGGFLELLDHFEIIKEFARLGGKYVRTATVGEPFLDRMFFNPNGTRNASELENSRFPLIQRTNRSGLWWTSFSNLLAVTEQIAEETAEMDVSFIGKLHSLDPTIQEDMTGNTGHFKPAHWAKFGEWEIPVNLKYLLDAGFNLAEGCGPLATTRLAVDIVATNINVKHIPAVVKFCLANNIYPFLEMLEDFGGAKSNASKFALSEYQLEWLYDELTGLLGVDFFGSEARACNNRFCPAYSTGLVYNPDGSIRYCYCVNSKTALNVKEHGLEAIYTTLCNSRDVIRARLDNCCNTKKTHLPLDPCPMGAHGGPVVSDMVLG